MCWRNNYYYLVENLERIVYIIYKIISKFVYKLAKMILATNILDSRLI